MGFNVYSSLQMSSSDPALDGGYRVDNELQDYDAAASPARLTPPPPAPLPPSCPKTSSVPADCAAAVDQLLLVDTEAKRSDDPKWENFSDLEFPRDALELIDTLGNSSFGEVRVSKQFQHSTYVMFVTGARISPTKCLPSKLRVRHI